MKCKYSIAVLVVLAVVFSVMVIPASATGTTVYTGVWDDNVGYCVMDTIPAAGDYKLYFTAEDWSGNAFSVDVSFLVLKEVSYGRQGIFSCIVPDFGNQELWMDIYIKDGCLEILNDDYYVHKIYEVTLTPIAAAAPDPGTGPDSEPTTNNFLADIGAFFTSCMKMLSDVLCIVINSPVLLVAVFAIPAIFFVISIASRLKM